MFLLTPIPDPPNAEILPWYGKERTLPAYRFVPGLYPHPIRDPKGHSALRAARAQIHPLWTPEEWPALEAYLHGIDLFNRFYFWESHEVWEALWKSHPPQDDPALFIQGLINLAASFLKLHMGSRSSTEKLWRASEERLTRFQGPPWMGISVDPFLAEIRAYLNTGKDKNLPQIGESTPSIRLVVP